METLSNQALSIGNMVGLFFLAQLVYGLAELYYVRRRHHAANLPEYRMMGVGLGFTVLVFGLVIVFIGPLNTTIFALFSSQYALFDAGHGPLGWIYGLIAYEGVYWLQHWAGHKVRLLWCVHAPHHAPESMSIFVGFNHSFLESVFYLPMTLGLLSGLLGVHPIVVAVISVVDAVWGNGLHLSDHVVTRRYGPLERFLQTPSYHRVHHAQNVRYMDTNYTSMTLLWDYLLGTLQPLDDDEPVIYGITRDVDTSSFRDAHFGEFALLWRDFRQAPDWRSALSYLFKPPGWSPDGAHDTVAALKQRMLDSTELRGSS